MIIAQAFGIHTVGMRVKSLVRGRLTRWKRGYKAPEYEGSTYHGKTKHQQHRCSLAHVGADPCSLGRHRQTALRSLQAAVSPNQFRLWTPRLSFENTAQTTTGLRQGSGALSAP